MADGWQEIIQRIPEKTKKTTKNKTFHATSLTRGEKKLAELPVLTKLKVKVL